MRIYKRFKKPVKIIVSVTEDPYTAYWIKEGEKGHVTFATSTNKRYIFFGRVGEPEIEEEEDYSIATVDIEVTEVEYNGTRRAFDTYSNMSIYYNNKEITFTDLLQQEGETIIETTSPETLPRFIASLGKVVKVEKYTW